ncbi:MAG: riboflavin kinase, partial [Candidatus Omnitrophica bacterium]|nr:riboflavin kinase [Candidatus Omnitrophota bacterium]
AYAEGNWFQGLLNCGYRPTFKHNHQSLVAEVFILDFEGDLYDKTLEVVFHPRLRPEKAFPNQAKLKAQIRTDIAQAREYFSKKVNLVQNDEESSYKHLYKPDPVRYTD